MASMLWAGCGELNNVDLKPNITLFCGEGCTNSTDRFQVTRTIGSGLSSDFSAAGEQLSYNVMVGLGVIEAQACVDLEIVSGADADVTASLLVNGRRWSTLIDGRSSRVAYLAFRADANLNKNYSVEGFSIIDQLSEACSKPLDNFCLPVNIVPYALPRPSTEIPINTIGASLSFIMQAVRQVSILEPSRILQFEAQSAPREFNDFAVADSSMLIHPFENAGEPLAAHHNALSSSSTAQLILSRITLEKQKSLEAK